MLLVVLAVLSVVLFPCPIYHWVREFPAVMTAVSIATLLPAAFAAWGTRRALHLFESHPEDPGHGQAYFAWTMTMVQGLLLTCHVGLLTVTNWPVICRRLTGLEDLPVVPTAMMLVPFVLSLLLVWIAVYPAERAIRQISVEIFLFRGKPTRPVWSLSQYLSYTFRHQLLFVLLPVLFIVLVRDAVDLHRDRLGPRPANDVLPDLILGAASMLVAIVAPVFLRYVWTTQPLPAGPLRDKLQRLSRILRLRFREILVWRSGGMVVNAAVMGVWGPMRYVLITDGMLEQMDDTRIEAVFGHEAGHAKRHHILYFLLFALISGSLVTVFSMRSRQMTMAEFQIAATLFAIFMAFKWFVVFGWISRRFEWQADAFGARTLTLAGVPCVQPCAVHTPEGTRRADADQPYKLCATAAHIYGDTLNEVAVLNGGQPDPPDPHGSPRSMLAWLGQAPARLFELCLSRHGTIGWRSRFVQKLAGDPDTLRRFERTVAGVKLAIFVCAVAAAAWAAIEMKIWSVLGLG